MATQEKQEKQIDSVTDYVEEKEDTNLQSGLSSLVTSSETLRFKSFFLTYLLSFYCSLTLLLFFFSSSFLLLFSSLLLFSFFSAPEIKISREDILLISDELDISKEEAEKLLRLNGGIVRQVFANFISA